MLQKQMEHQIFRAWLQNTLSPHSSSDETGINPRQKVLRNPATAIMYEQAIVGGHGSTLCMTGALAAYSGVKTGRSPKDKRIVDEAATTAEVWWGPVNIQMEPSAFLINRERCIDFLNMQEVLYVIDGFYGWDSKLRFKVRAVCSRAYHALFMSSILVKPTESELENFGEADFVIYNAGSFPANRYTEGVTSGCSIAIDLTRNEMCILGTLYAGEMKKGLFTVLNHMMPKQGHLPLHAACNVGIDGSASSPTLFLGLSGSGKTVLSADPNRRLLSDDLVLWSSEGISNPEGGCHAKCKDLNAKDQPLIYNAIRFGSLLENVPVNRETREPDFNSTTITHNTRATYPLEFISNALVPAIVNAHPTNVIFLVSDAFGVFPAVAKLTVPQAIYQFLNGFTSRPPDQLSANAFPVPTFSACFAGPFLVFHPTRYATLLTEKLNQHKPHLWLVNTGWTGGKMATQEGSAKISVQQTRAVLNAIHNGSMPSDASQYEAMPGFNYLVPRSCPDVPTELLHPWKGENAGEYMQTLAGLIGLFRKNFEKYTGSAAVSADVFAANPAQP